MKENGFLTDYQSATNLTCCQSTNFFERLKYGDFFIKMSSSSVNVNSFPSESAALEVWNKLRLFVNTRNYFQNHLKRKSYQDKISEFENREGKGVADIFHDAIYKYRFNDNPINPTNYFDFSNLNKRNDSPFCVFIKRHFNIYNNFNRIFIAWPDYLYLYDDVAHEQYYPCPYDDVTRLVQYVLIKIGEGFSFSDSVPINVPSVRIID